MSLVVFSNKTPKVHTHRRSEGFVNSKKTKPILANVHLSSSSSVRIIYEKKKISHHASALQDGNNNDLFLCLQSSTQAAYKMVAPV